MEPIHAGQGVRRTAERNAPFRGQQCKPRLQSFGRDALKPPTAELSGCSIVEVRVEKVCRNSLLDDSVLLIEQRLELLVEFLHRSRSDRMGVRSQSSRSLDQVGRIQSGFCICNHVIHISARPAVAGA